MPYARFAAAFAETCGRAPKLSEARFREAASPENFIAVRKLPGGPAPEALAEAAIRHRAGAQRLRDRLAAHSATAKAAHDKLAARTGG